MSASTEPVDPKASEASVDTSEQLEINAAQGAESSDEALAHPPAPENWEQQLAETEAKVAQYHEELLRARAEVENVRRRSQEEIAKARKFGTESFAESLIPVKDSLEAALGLTDQTAQSWKEGVEATLRQLNTAFERNLMKEIAPVAGDRFDPHQHQAISSVPSDQPQGAVVQLLQKGYLIADRVLRPALVMVSAGKAA
jgi:molecular chaperone GrpE